MKKSFIFSDKMRVNYIFEEKFKLAYFQESPIPFLFLKNSFEENFYYFRRFKISVADIHFRSLKSDAGKVKIGIIANSVEDMTLGDRIVRDYNLLNKSNCQVFIIPMGFDWTLSSQDSVTYQRFVAEYFDLLISLGGDDIHPSLYNQKNLFAQNVNFERDLSEFNLVKYYKKYSTGVFLGICRGHQLSAIIDGFELIQDLGEINSECLAKHRKSSNENPEYIYHSVQINPSLLSRLFGYKNNSTFCVNVNSYHHQAVKFSENKDSFCAALDKEHNVIEALVSNNHKSISVQFHPELPNELNKNHEFTELGHSFIRRVVAYARLHKRFKIKTTSDISQTQEVNSQLPSEQKFRKFK